MLHCPLECHCGSTLVSYDSLRCPCCSRSVENIQWVASVDNCARNLLKFQLIHRKLNPLSRCSDLMLSPFMNENYWRCVRYCNGLLEDRNVIDSFVWLKTEVGGHNELGCTIDHSTC